MIHPVHNVCSDMRRSAKKSKIVSSETSN